MLVVVLPCNPTRVELDDAERQPLTAENARCDPVPVREGGESVSRALRGLHRDFVSEDAVLTRVVYRARYSGDFPGVSAAGAPIELTGLGVFRFDDDRVVEHLHEADHEALWEQLGVRLPPGSSANVR